MGLREFLRLPKIRLRKKSKARSEIGPIEGPSAVDPAEPHPASSTPNLRIDSSTSATPTPLTSTGQEFKDRSEPVSNEGQSEYPGSSNTASKPGGAGENNPNLEMQGGGGNETPSRSGEGPSNVDPPETRLEEPTPDPGIGSPSSPTSHSTPHVQEPKDRSATDPIQSPPGRTEVEQSGSPENIIEQDVSEESKSNLGSLVVSAAKLTLRGVEEAADAFPPLKAVAGSLCFILDNCEQTMACNKVVELLSPRIAGLAKSLNKPVPTGEAEEAGRRQTLIRKLDGVLKDLNPLEKQGNIVKFLENAENVDKLSGMVEDIRDAVMEYQTSLQQDLSEKGCRLIEGTDLILLNQMHHATNAGYLSGNRRGCMRGTRRDVLLQLQNWLKDVEDKHVFWLNGLAGTGKSTIAQTFAEMAFADGILGASFFCSRDYKDRSNLHTIFPTLALQLARRYPGFRKALVQVLKQSPDVGQETLYSQMEKLIVGPFGKTQIHTLIVIDALDECKDEEPASALLSVLSRFLHKIPSVKFFITGRPELPIRRGFRLKSLQPHTEIFKLHEVKPSSIDSDIRLYFKAEFITIAKGRSDWNLSEEWPSAVDLDICAKRQLAFSSMPPQLLDLLDLKPICLMLG